MDGGTYRQAPYESIDESQYNLLLSGMPTAIDWNEMREVTDNVEGVQTLACTAGACEI
jgi:ribonucleoside-diphosphate reductase alpha chain